MITSVSNEKVKHIVRLQKKASARQEENCFLVEGVQMAQELPVERLVLAYASESFAARPEQKALCRRLRGHEAGAGQREGLCSGLGLSDPLCPPPLGGGLSGRGPPGTAPGLAPFSQKMVEPSGENQQGR